MSNKQLYESIMKSVSKAVKNKLDEKFSFSDYAEVTEFVEQFEEKPNTPFYIMSDTSFDRLKGTLKGRCKIYNIFDSYKYIVVPVNVSANFYDALNTKLMQMNDFYMFTLNTIGDDIDIIKQRIRYYIESM